MPEIKEHNIHKSNWLRAAVLGANDGLVSTASLLVGVAAASTGRPEILLAGVAGLFAGALSMAAGEYVSVSSQSDLETAEIDREIGYLKTNPERELQELVDIYIARGMRPELAQQVAEELTDHDALLTHARDELGISDENTANAFQAAWASAASFACGAAMPLLMAVIAPLSMIIPIVVIATLISLGLLGAIGAHIGRAPKRKPVLRVVFWGAFAMGITALIGTAFGTVD